MSGSDASVFYFGRSEEKTKVEMDEKRRGKHEVALPFTLSASETSVSSITSRPVTAVSAVTPAQPNVDLKIHYLRPNCL